MTIGFIPNLHVILLGDEFRAGEYLPYGKQLVRQLMAVGGYSGKRVVSPEDGVLVEAWTSGEHRWVRITAVGCPSIFMDSGLAGLHNIGLQNPALTGQDGTLHYGTTIKAYLSQKKLLGKIKPPIISCTPSVELDATKAYAAETKVIDGKTVRDSGSEGVLAVKKSFTARMPASLFTGKLRLWVQAQYGKPLAEWNMQPNWQNQPPSWDLMTEASGESRLFQIHSSHTGIFTDANKRHWLVQFGVKGAYADGTNVNIFRMAAPKCVEALRSQILDSSPLSVDEKERVEAYLLSQSYPDYDFCISKTLPSLPMGGMGYGWHFNWSGGKADIVCIASIELGGSLYKFRSTHYRISLSRSDGMVNDASNTALQNESRRWKAELSTVETADWKNPKWVNVIASPDWAEGTLAIFGQMWGTNFGSGAPIYCFYTRDELQVVRYSYSGGESKVEYMRASSPSYFGGNVGWNTSGAGACLLNTVGLEGGSTEYRMRVNTPASTSFSVGATSISVSDQSYSGGRQSVGGKKIVSEVFFGASMWVGEWWTWTGDPIDVVLGSTGCISGAGLWAETGLGPGWYAGSASISVEMTGVSSSISHSEGSNTLCVIPFGDAEAVYLWGQKWVSSYATGTSGTGATSMFVRGGCRYDDVTASVIIDKWYYNYFYDYVPGGSTPYEEPPAETYSNLGAIFISNAGVKSFSPATVASAFFAGEPNSHVSQNFWTNTSAGLTPATYGYNVAQTGGYITSGVYMGWA